MKKYIAFALLLIIINCCITFTMVQYFQRETAKPLQTEQLSTEISDKIIAREIVDTSIIKDLDEDLQAKIAEYNTMTGVQKRNMAGVVMDELKKHFGYVFRASTYCDLPQEVRIICEKASTYMLYGNARELMLRDSDIAMSFGENADWKAFVMNYTHYDMDEYFSLVMDEYFSLVDEIMAQLPLNEDYHKDKIRNRQVIEDTYINCLDDENLAKKLREYNKITAENHEILAENAVETIRYFLCIENEPYSHFDDNENVRKYAAKVAEYSLYEERANMMYTDEELGALLSLEMGGSAGIWPRHIGFEGEAEYFKLVEELLKY